LITVDSWADRSAIAKHHCGRLQGHGQQQIPRNQQRDLLARGECIVVLLHADGQYAPESLPQIIAPFLTTKCAAVFGSRMMDKGAAKSGGMPFYKRLGTAC